MGYEPLNAVNEQKGQEDRCVKVAEEGQGAINSHRRKVVRNSDRAEDVWNLEHDTKAKQVKAGKLKLSKIPKTLAENTTHCRLGSCSHNFFRQPSKDEKHINRKGERVDGPCAKFQNEALIDY